MKTMTQKEMNEMAVADAIVASMDGQEGKFATEVEVDGKLVEVAGYYEIDGYCEDDYFNGTGAYVVTHAYVEIDSLDTYGDDGEEVDGNLDWSAIEAYAKCQLSA